MNGESGIHGWGVAIPRRRLQNRLTEEAWNRPALPGSRCIAGHDEDAITLGVQAVMGVMEDGHVLGAHVAPVTIDALMFASTTAPFTEKSCATVIADTLDLRTDALCMDLNTSRRSGAIALAAACNFVRAGAARYVLVVAADTTRARPGDPDECLYGQAGVAVLVGPAKGARVRILHHSCYRHSQTDVWRTPESRFPLRGDSRFSQLGAYAIPMQSVLKQILQAAGWKPADVRRAVLYSPDVKSGVTLLKRNGFDPKEQYCDCVSARTGLTGTGHTLLMLAAALEKSVAGDCLIAQDYGDGAGAFALQVCDNPTSSIVEEALSQGYDVSYNHYLRLHGLHSGAEINDRPFSSEAMAERHKRLWRALKAKRCLSCEGVLTLPLPTCPRCAGPTDFEEYPLKRRGTVFAVTHEHYFPTHEPPLGMAVVHVDGGGRLTLQIADEDSPLEIGEKVELVFRRLHDGGRMPNYFWKCRSIPVKQGGGA